MALVHVDAVSKTYPRRVGLRTEMRTVVENVSFEIVAGETLGLVRESGSGKTTVARIGLVQPSQGAIRVAGVDVAHASRTQLKALRREMQPVFQDPYAALNPRMKVLDIITEPWAIHGIDAGSAADEQEHRGTQNQGTQNRRTQDRRTLLRTRAIELLREVGLDDSALGRHPHEFSGGQRQRINIARVSAAAEAADPR
jgi:peptide/nickel transport system ATP-binding protein